MWYVDLSSLTRRIRFSDFVVPKYITLTTRIPRNCNFKPIRDIICITEYCRTPLVYIVDIKI